MTDKVKIQKGSGNKNPPYDFDTAVGRVRSKVTAVAKLMIELPRDACPGNEAVAALTMHPRYISKSDFPDALLDSLGLRAVGSRAVPVRPEQWGIKKPPDSAIADEIYIAGPRDSFIEFSDIVSNWKSKGRASTDLTHIEDVTLPPTSQKLRKVVAAGLTELWLETVLHDGSNVHILDAFEAYVQELGAKINMDKRVTVRGISFVPVFAGVEMLERLAKFAFLRVARSMPTLRPLNPGVLRSVPSQQFSVQLPAGAPLSAQHRAVIFDGGIPPDQRLAPWVTAVEPPGIGPSVPGYLEHGLAVTSALLFGPLSKGVSPLTPLFPIDHVRVLDDASGIDCIEYLDVLGRIQRHLVANAGRYAFANVSVGPDISIDDDDVTAWTALFDELFAGSALLATVAAGNNGEADAAAGLNRVQPPADAVNVLSVGAIEGQAKGSARAAYSCVGPGRSPGRVKPDGLAFGGCEDEPFYVLATTPHVRGTRGTSFAAPFALRTIGAAAVQLTGSTLSSLALRALAIHRADGAPAQAESGWGRFESDPSLLVTVEDDEAIVIYQGSLPVGAHLRLGIPVNNVKLVGDVTLSATVVIAPEVDPQYPGTYTRSGLEVTFRPHSTKKGKAIDGKVPNHAKSQPFFSEKNMYSASEFQFREDGHKWEPCLKGSKTLRASSINQTCFDVYYHSRLAGGKHSSPQPIPYAFVVGIKAPKVPDLYNQVVRNYASILTQLRPTIRIPVST